MVPGSVGFQCPECLERGLKETRQRELPHGGTRSANPRTTSIVLIAMNAIVWLAVLLTGWHSSRLIDLFALYPEGQCFSAEGAYLVGKQQCLEAGLQWADGVGTGAFWQVLTSGFTHVELLHFGFNMLIIWMLGANLEQILGRARFLAVYLISLLGGSAAVMWLSESFIPVVGASGAIYGLLAALLLLAIRYKGDVRNIVIWLAINVVFSFVVANVSWQGHLGGFLAGAAVTAVLVWLPKQKRSLQWPLVGAIAVLVVVAIAVRALTFA